MRVSQVTLVSGVLVGLVGQLASLPALTYVAMAMVVVGGLLGLRARDGGGGR